MDDNKEKALNDFLEVEETETESVDKDNKTVILDEREGLIERVDKILVTSDGKQLLREQY